MTKELKKLIKETRKNLKPNSKMHDGLISITNLIECFYNYIEENVDKLINKVAKDMKKKDMPAAKKDMKVLKKADKVQDKKLEKIKKKK